MKERPILFSGAMVRAILEGRKSQTRRLLRVPNHPAVKDWVLDSEFRAAARAHSEKVADQYVTTFPFGRVRCPYGQPGDRLWVRETFGRTEGAPRRAGEAPVEYTYKADQIYALDGYQWKRSIFMPRAACRLVLEVTDVRVERLREISEEDAEAEGVELEGGAALWPHINRGDKMKSAYRYLWDSLNAKRAPWLSNPWVWVIEFKKRSER